MINQNFRFEIDLRFCELYLVQVFSEGLSQRVLRTFGEDLRQAYGDGDRDLISCQFSPKEFFVQTDIATPSYNYFSPFISLRMWYRSS